MRGLEERSEHTRTSRQARRAAGKASAAAVRTLRLRSPRFQEGDMSYAWFAWADWPAPELVTSTDPDVSHAARRLIVADDARLTRLQGGNMVRIFWSLASLLHGPAEDVALAVNAPGLHPLRHPAVYVEDMAARLAALDRADVVLNQLVAAVSGNEGGPIAVEFGELDAAFGGIEDANSGPMTTYGSCWRSSPSRHARSLRRRPTRRSLRMAARTRSAASGTGT